MKRLNIFLIGCLCVMLAWRAFAQGFGVVPNVTFPPMVNGWHVFTPVTKTAGTCAAGTSDGTCILYVTSADLGVGVAGCIPQEPPVTDTPAASVQCDSRTAIQTAVNKMRVNRPDWFLLKKNDVWTNWPGFSVFSAGLARFGGQPCSTVYSYNTYVIGSGCTTGLTCATPSLFSSWPSTPGARPLLLNAVGIQSLNINSTLGGGGDNVAVVGWEFNDYTRNPNDPNFITQPSGGNGGGFNSQTKISCTILENNKFSWYGGNIAIGTPQGFPLYFQTGIYLYRNVISNSYNTVRAQGMFGSAMCNPTFEQNTFFSGGTPPLATVTGKIDNGAGGAGTTLTVTAVSPATYPNVLAKNQALAGTGISGGTLITGFLDVNADYTGTYTVNNPQNVALTTITATLPGASGVAADNHDLYWDETGCYGVYKYNIAAHSATSIQGRPGGVYYDNFSEGNGGDIATGANSQPGVTSVNYNVSLNGKTNTPYAFETVGNNSVSTSNYTRVPLPGNTTYVSVTDNIAANAPTTTQCIVLTPTAQGIPPTTNAVVTRNVCYNWGTANGITNVRGGITVPSSNGLPLTITSGSGYTPGFYFRVPMTGGTGSGVFANLRVGAGGGVTEATIQNTTQSQQYSTSGQGYQVGDVLKPLNNVVAGLLNTAQITVSGVSQLTGGIVSLSNPVGSGGSTFARSANVSLGYVSGSMQGGAAQAIVLTDANGNVIDFQIPNTNGAWTLDAAVINGKIDNGSGAPGSILTINSTAAGAMAVGRYIYGAGVAGNTRTSANLGGGQWQLINGQCSVKIDDGAGGAGTTLTINAGLNCDGAYPQVGQIVTGVGVAANTTITGVISVANRTYTVNNSQLIPTTFPVPTSETLVFTNQQNVASETMQAGFAASPSVSVGTGFTVGDVLSPLSGNIYMGGAGSGFQFTVNSVADSCAATANNCNTGNTFCVAGVCTPTTTYPNPGNATVANYNSQVLGTGVTQATCTGSLTGYALTLTGCTGTAVAVGQLVRGTGVTPGTIILAGSGSTWTVNNNPASPIGPETMTTEKADFFTCALYNSKDFWNDACTALTINNWVRDQFGQPHVNWLLRRDIDPAANDNLPFGLLQAA